MHPLMPSQASMTKRRGFIALYFAAVHSGWQAVHVADARSAADFERVTFAAPNVKSLAWVGDELVDVAGGWRRFLPGGTVTDARIFYAFSFDRAVGAAAGEYAALYATLGTKGLILKNGELAHARSIGATTAPTARSTR